jgi:hypothetical protein
VLGRTEDAARFQKDYDTLRAHFVPILDARSAANGGAIPPALDGDNGGADWGNLLSVVPEPQLDPHDSKVTATLDRMPCGYTEVVERLFRHFAGATTKVPHVYVPECMCTQQPEPY